MLASNTGAGIFSKETERKLFMSEHGKGYNELAEDVFQGLHMYVLDINLNPEEEKKYTEGLIFREKHWLEVCSRIQGMKTCHRYTILSNHILDVQDGKESRKVVRENGYFKVLDVYSYQGKTQILLLHLPEDNRWRDFEEVTFLFEEHLIRDSRLYFEKTALEEGGASQERRHPLGWDEDGSFYPLEISPVSQKEPVKDLEFRDMYHQFLYLEGEGIEACVQGFEKGVDTGVVAYGYIEEEEGLHFLPLWIGREEGKVFQWKALQEKERTPLSLREVETCYSISGRYLDLDVTTQKVLAKKVEQEYEIADSEKKRMRKLEFLDGFRDWHHPDCILVALVTEQHPPEQVWIQVCGYSEKGIEGKLLMSPSSAPHLQKGERIFCVPHTTEKGDRILLSPQ